MTPEYIIVHDSDSAYGNTFVIDDWHQKRGFAWQHKGSGVTVHVGYHFLILNGSLWDGHATDARYDGLVVPCRPEDAVGAHCQAQGMNGKSLGVCVIGPAFTPDQRAALVGLIINLQKKYQIPRNKVLGHKEVDPSNKSDPRFDMDGLRNQLEA